jgi:sulfotransferase family protein
MLAWPPGPRDTDGVWAPHWYDGVRASTGFAPYTTSDRQVADRLQPLLAECIPYYEKLASQRLRIEEATCSSDSTSETAT